MKTKCNKSIIIAISILKQQMILISIVLQINLTIKEMMQPMIISEMNKTLKIIEIYYKLTYLVKFLIMFVTKKIWKDLDKKL